MQKRNDYDKGVYNGDVGIVWSVTDKRIAVSFYDREVVYEKRKEMTCSSPMRRRSIKVREASMIPSSSSSFRHSA